MRRHQGPATIAGRPGDVVKSTLYVVDWDIAKMGDLIAGSIAANSRHAFSDAPVTLIGVDRLFVPDHLIEVEVVAVADAA